MEDPAMCLLTIQVNTFHESTQTHNSFILIHANTQVKSVDLKGTFLTIRIAIIRTF